MIAVEATVRLVGRAVSLETGIAVAIGVAIAIIGLAFFVFLALFGL